VHKEKESRQASILMCTNPEKMTSDKVETYNIYTAYIQQTTNEVYKSYGYWFSLRPHLKQWQSMPRHWQ
jgi:hypothetical protein